MTLRESPRASSSGSHQSPSGSSPRHGPTPCVVSSTEGFCSCGVTHRDYRRHAAAPRRTRAGTIVRGFRPKRPWEGAEIHANRAAERESAVDEGHQNGDSDRGGGEQGAAEGGAVEAGIADETAQAERQGEQPENSRGDGDERDKGTDERNRRRDDDTPPKPPEGNR